jgi:hypothetical protein
MPCMVCLSANEAEFASEIVIHFSGPKNLDKSGVFVFPRLLVCLDCGFSQFTVPKSDLAALAGRTRTNGAATG